MGILNSEDDLRRKRESEDRRASDDIFSMSQDTTLAPVFRNIARQGHDYIVCLENELECATDNLFSERMWRESLQTDNQRLREALTEIAEWNQADEDDPDICRIQWRGCVAIARAALEGGE